MSEIYTYYWHDTKTTTQCHKNTCSTIFGTKSYLQVGRYLGAV